MFPRLCNPLLSNSFILLGARGTGKSKLVDRLIAPEERLTIDLLQPDLERRLRRRPEELTSMIRAKKNLSWVFIDEVQKVPELLNLAHYHIEASSIRFALTGSSARKLRRRSVNLLAGRAFSYHLFPLTFVELDAAFDIHQILSWGSLPKVVNSETDQERKIFLESYASTYLKQEILEEQLVRNVTPFESFLEVSAQMNGEILNFSKIGRTIGSNHKSAQSYFDILIDTLMGFYLPAFSTSARKRAISSPKFYFFDGGIKRALDSTLGDSLNQGTYSYGKAFESLVVQEIYRLNSYYRCNYELSYLRTQSGVEIDLILRRGRQKLILIEIKSTDTVRSEHLSSLRSLAKDLSPTAMYCLSLDPAVREEEGVKLLPWQAGVRHIFDVEEYTSRPERQ